MDKKFQESSYFFRPFKESVFKISIDSEEPKIKNVVFCSKISIWIILNN